MSKGKVPDYKGEGVAVWLNTDKNGNTYLSIRVLGVIDLKAFKYEPREIKEKKPQIVQPTL